MYIPDRSICRFIVYISPFRDVLGWLSFINANEDESETMFVIIIASIICSQFVMFSIGWISAYGTGDSICFEGLLRRYPSIGYGDKTRACAIFINV